MDLCQVRCENKPSPASDHAFPSSSRVELLIRTIAEANMALWDFPWASLISQAAHGDEHFRENCSVHSREVLFSIKYKT